MNMHVNWKQLPGCKFWLPCVYPIELNLIIRCEQCSDQTLVMPLYQSNHSKQRLMVMVEIKSYLYDSSNSIFYVYVGKIRMFTLKWPRGNCFYRISKISADLINFCWSEWEPMASRSHSDSRQALLCVQNQ